MKLKILSLILAVSFATAALAGCGDAEKTASSAGNSSDSSSSVSEAADSPATSDKEEDKSSSNVSASADNGLGNLTNSDGYAVTDGEWIYFRSNMGGIAVYARYEDALLFFYADTPPSEDQTELILEKLDLPEGAD